jgi:iron complex outermembrane recepter protein
MTNVLFFAVLAFTLDTQPVTDPHFAETMVVSAIRAEADTPVTKSDIPREDIEARYHGQDVPLLLRETPSINAYVESGAGGAGYSYISLRGIGSTRINFTLDGVPLADSEDMGTYFADFPDLARSLESVQIQRGVGTSTVGSASFGGSVNMESVALRQESQLDATLGVGSFGNRQVSAGYHSGLLPGDLMLYGRVSYLESDGFRDNSAMRQRNVFFSGAKQLGETQQLKLTGFSGREWQQLSFYATDADTLRGDLRANPLRPEEKDSFGYDLAQLQYIRTIDAQSDMTASAYYQRGYGWYRLFDFGTDVLREYGLDGTLLGGMVTYSRRSGAVTVNSGVHANHFKRDHTRDDLTLATRDYANYGVKGEANAFAKVSWDANRLHLYGDAQMRHASFDYHGDVNLPAISWTFFNPKAGARYSLTPASSVYASAGMTTREPARNDLFHGDDNPAIPYDLRAVKPERVYDFEGGWSYQGPRAGLSANLYAMEFRNEIAATGELSEIGLPLRRNVDKSFRRGLEVEADWRPSASLRLRTNANVSRNEIAEWTQFYDGGSIVYRDVEPLLTPSVILSQSAEYRLRNVLTVGAIGRWVGKSYLDNTNDPDLVTPSFFTADGTVAWQFNERMRLSLQVNNLLNNDRVYASGYSYLYLDGGTPTGIPYYYPQATRNALVLLDLDVSRN